MEGRRNSGFGKAGQGQAAGYVRIEKWSLGIKKKKLAEIKKKSWSAQDSNARSPAPRRSKLQRPVQPTKPRAFSAPSTHQIISILFLLLVRNLHIYFFFPQKVGVSIDTPCPYVPPPMPLWSSSSALWMIRKQRHHMGLNSEVRTQRNKGADY